MEILISEDTPRDVTLTISDTDSSYSVTLGPDQVRHVWGTLGNWLKSHNRILSNEKHDYVGYPS